MEKAAQNQNIGYQIPHFFFFFSLSRLKQAVVAHPFLCLVMNKHILLHVTVCLMEGWLNHSNPYEVSPVNDMAAGIGGWGGVGPMK